MDGEERLKVFQNEMNVSICMSGEIRTPMAFLIFTFHCVGGFRQPFPCCYSQNSSLKNTNQFCSDINSV